MRINGHLRINVRTDVVKIKSNDITFHSILLPAEFKAVPNFHISKHAAMNILTCASHTSVSLLMPRFP